MAGASLSARPRGLRFRAAGIARARDKGPGHAGMGAGDGATG